MKTKKPASCHPDRPIHAKGLCHYCYQKDLMQRNPAFAKRQKEATRSSYKRQEHRRKTGQIPDTRKYGPAKAAQERLRKYNITDEQYQEMVKNVGGVCEICGDPQKNGDALCVDHDHSTGALRGLLCRKCNMALGRFRDSPTLLRNAVAYLERSKK